MNSASPVRLGLLGCGWIAGNRLRQIAESRPRRVNVEVTVVADPTPEAAASARSLAPAARIVGAMGDADLDAVDGVMISTPSALHFQQACALLERGKPVFVQKPLALCGEDARRLMALAAAGNLPLQTDLCYRHLNSTQAVRRELRAGRSGRPFLVEGCFHNAYRPGAGWSHDAALAGGGALMDLGIHLIDLVTWLTGQPLVLERARLLKGGRRLEAGEVEDFALVDLALPDGAPVRLATSWDASTGRDAQIALRFYGCHGCLEISNRNGSFFDFDANLYRGAGAEHLAEDLGDSWQAGPLEDWLIRLADDTGYLEESGMEQPLALVNQAYECNRRAAAPGPRTETEHVPGRKGVLQ